MLKLRCTLLYAERQRCTLQPRPTARTFGLQQASGTPRFSITHPIVLCMQGYDYKGSYNYKPTNLTEFMLLTT